MSKQSMEYLRTLLDEHGVKHEDKRFYTYWKDIYGNSWVAKDDGYDDLYCHPCYAITAEQAIEITLGTGICREIEYEDTGIIVCSECGAIHDEDYTQYFCWNCGRKVVN